ncbi:MAG: MoaD/ThiS family protein [Burkholderiales bacterium]
MLRLLYFAQLAEQLGRTLDEVERPAEVTDAAALLNWLRLRGSPWNAVFAVGNAMRITVNRKFADPGSAIVDGDEIGFFPMPQRD